MRPSLLLTLLFACQDKAPEPSHTGRTDDSAPPADTAETGDPGEAQGRLQGVVRDLSGAPLAGVTLTVGATQVTADAIGFYATGELDAGTHLVRAELDGYGTGYARAAVMEGGWGYADLTLLPALDYSWDPESGEPVRTEEGAEIALPVGGIVDAFGATYDGAVTVRVTLLDELAELDGAPVQMAFLGEDGEPHPLETAGAMEVRLLDGAGLPLSLAAPARVSWDLIDAERLASDAEIGLWGLDEDLGLWTPEAGGSVTDGRFSAEVAHFSWWNADAEPAFDACLNATFTFEGEPVEGATVRISLSGTTLSSGEVTDADGRVQVDLFGDRTWQVRVEDGVWHLDAVDVYVPSAPDGPCTEAGPFALALVDLDGDSVPSEDYGGADCDDDDPLISPLADEIWYDGVDQDCDANDGDQDGDGYLVVGYSGPVTDGFDEGDCDDEDDLVYPGRVELCDGIDQNCSGDESDASDATLWYTDADGDGYGTDDSEIRACEAPDGAVAAGGDCLDDPALDPDGRWHPLADEVCGDPDYNCDGDADLVDSDGDGVLGCEGDCDDGDPAVWLGAPETCDGLDNDCDGEVDGAAVETVFYRDLDLDGYGDPAVPLSACDAPDGYVEDRDDCDDADEDAWPGAEEICEDSVIQNCRFDAAEAARECGWLEPALDYLAWPNRLSGDFANVGDATGDGLDDLVFDAAYDAQMLPGTGETGELTFSDLAWSLDHPSSGVYADSVGYLGDADGDGYADVPLGALRSTLGTAGTGGTAFLVYGPITATVSLRDAELMVSSGAGAYVGSTVEGVGDLDGDALPELGVAASATLTLGLFGGAPTGDRLLSEADWVLSATSTTGAIEPARGSGDLDGDGLDDLVTAAAGAAVGGVSATGQVQVHWAPDAGALAAEDADVIVTGTDDATRLGALVAVAEDADGDGLDDLYLATSRGVGLWFVSGGDLRSGRVDGVATGLLYGDDVTDQTPSDLDARLDLDVDGQGDAVFGVSNVVYLVFGAPTGAVHLSALEPHVIGAYADYWGSGTKLTQDLSGDGQGELVVTGPEEAGEEEDPELRDQVFIFHSGMY